MSKRADRPIAPDAALIGSIQEPQASGLSARARSVLSDQPLVQKDTMLTGRIVVEYAKHSVDWNFPAASTDGS